MKNYYDSLKLCPMFADMSSDDIDSLMKCLSASRKWYEKGSFVFTEGDEAGNVGIVLSGAVHVLREDFWGRRNLLARIETGGLFGESFAFARMKLLPVSVTAAEDSEILFIDASRIMTTCAVPCIYHADLIKNLTLILARRNVMLTQKLEHVTRPTTREKLLSYLSEQSRLAGSNAFDIPFNREELADYLSVDRSAMSAELSKMRCDGLLKCRKSHFELLN
jgi:cAMP-binding proteins - catabolite gene activator and regulatory subunit of cAMP-dependent protein kinases